MEAFIKELCKSWRVTSL